MSIIKGWYGWGYYRERIRDLTVCEGAKTPEDLRTDDSVPSPNASAKWTIYEMSGRGRQGTHRRLGQRRPLLYASHRALIESGFHVRVD